MTRALLPLALLLTACPGGDTDDTDASTACTTTYTPFPEDGATRAYYRTAVDATFSAVADGATITVTDSAGAEVAGAQSWEGTRLIFTPSAPLTPGASYTTGIAFDCNGEAVSGTVNWTVSEVGASTDANGLVGNDYSLDLGNARFLRPEGIGSVIGEFIGDVEILLSVQAVDGTNLDVFGALGDENAPGTQAACTQTIDFPAADFSENPYFEVGPQQFSVSVQGTDVVIEDLFLGGSFAPDGSYIDGAVLTGVIDTRLFAGLIDDSPEPDPNAVCEFAERLAQISCIACPDNSGDFCLEIYADSIAATSEGVADLVEIPDPCALSECAAEPECTQDD